MYLALISLKLLSLNSIYHNTFYDIFPFPYTNLSLIPRLNLVSFPGHTQSHSQAKLEPQSFTGLHSPPVFASITVITTLVQAETGKAREHGCCALTNYLDMTCSIGQ